MRYALKRELDVDFGIDLQGVKRGTVFFPPDLVARVGEIAEQHGVSMQVASAALAQASFNDMNAKAQPEHQPDDKKAGLSQMFSGRAEQTQFFEAISTGLSGCKLVVAEASTGVGKGRALMGAALEAAKSGKTPVVVAAPTILIVNQLWAELQELKEHSQGVTASIYPGASEFVDDLKLLEWFEDEAHQRNDPLVYEWVKNGALHDANTPLAQMTKGNGIQLAWMMSDFANIAVNMPILDFMLRSDKSKEAADSEARNLLASIRKISNRKTDDQVHSGAEIILCTHMMLAISQKTQWAALPKPEVVVIDEAHSFEETLSRANSHFISIFSIRYRLSNFCRKYKSKKNSIPRKALDVASALMKYCQNIEHSDLRMKISSDTREYEEIYLSLSELSNLTSSRAFAKEVSIQSDLCRLVSDARHDMGATKNTVAIYLEFSPDKRYPSLSIGADSVSLEAGAIWKAVQGGAVLASATMYLTDEYGNSKCDYIVRNLSIPLTRLATPAPIESAHIYTTPNLHYPSKNAIGIFSRPSQKERTVELENIWLTNVSKKVLSIAESSKGGVLVLASSYDQIRAIDLYLRTNKPEMAERLVTPTRGEKFGKKVDEFKSIYKKGGRPVLIGLGPAWTGLDLSDKESDPLNDNLLTDLVIACCPIGLNRSPTMQKRIENNPTYAISKEALMLFKQGLGRLIRRGGLSNRHIWILDGRLWSGNWLNQFASPAKRILSKYKKFELFDL